jgi:hypothetical protein
MNNEATNTGSLPFLLLFFRFVVLSHLMGNR